MSKPLCTSAVKTDQAKAGQDSVEEAATAGAGPSTAAADEPKDKPAASASSGGSDLPIQLSAMRKADVSPFKGIVYVSIREYYEVSLPAWCPSQASLAVPSMFFLRHVFLISKLAGFMLASCLHGCLHTYHHTCYQHSRSTYHGTSTLYLHPEHDHN